LLHNLRMLILTFYLQAVIFTGRRYGKRGICHRRVSVCVCVCVCHTPVLYQNC